MFDMLMKQLGIDPEQIQTQFEQINAFVLNTGAHQKSVDERLTRIEAMIAEIHSHLKGTKDG